VLVFLAPIVSGFFYGWYYLYYSVSIIIDYSEILFNDSTCGLVSTLLDTTLNLVSFFILYFTIIVIILASRYNTYLKAWIPKVFQGLQWGQLNKSLFFYEFIKKAFEYGSIHHLFTNVQIMYIIFTSYVRHVPFSLQAFTIPFYPLF